LHAGQVPSILDSQPRMLVLRPRRFSRAAPRRHALLSFPALRLAGRPTAATWAPVALGAATARVAHRADRGAPPGAADAPALARPAVAQATDRGAGEDVGRRRRGLPHRTGRSSVGRRPRGSGRSVAAGSPALRARARPRRARGGRVGRRLDPPRSCAAPRERHRVGRRADGRRRRERKDVLRCAGAAWSTGTAHPEDAALRPDGQAACDGASRRQGRCPARRRRARPDRSRRRRRAHGAARSRGGPDDGRDAFRNGKWLAHGREARRARCSARAGAHARPSGRDSGQRARKALGDRGRERRRRDRGPRPAHGGPDVRRDRLGRSLAPRRRRAPLRSRSRSNGRDARSPRGWRRGAHGRRVGGAARRRRSGRASRARRHGRRASAPVVAPGSGPRHGRARARAWPGRRARRVPGPGAGQGRRGRRSRSTAAPSRSTRSRATAAPWQREAR
jgi:hypothetical protein